MEVTYTPTQSDYIRFNWDTVFSTPKLLLTVLASVLFVPMFWIAILYSVLGNIGEFWELAAVLVAIWAAFMLWSIQRSVIRRVKASPLTLQKTTAHIGPEGFQLEQDQLDMKIAWAGVNRVVARPRHIYIYRTSQTAWIIPKRAFATQAGAEEFQRAALDYWKAGRISGNKPQSADRANIPAESSRIAFELTLEDTLHYEKMFIGRVTNVSTRRVYGFSIYMLVIGLVIIGFSIDSLLAGRLVFSTYMLVGLICIGWAVFTFLSRTSWLTRRRVRQLVASTPGLTGARTVSIDPSGYYEATDVTNLRIGWSSILDVTEEGDYIYIFESRIRAHPVPKRAFSSPYDAQAFFHAARGYNQQAKSGALVDKPTDGSWPPAPTVRL